MHHLVLPFHLVVSHALLHRNSNRSIHGTDRLLIDRRIQTNLEVPHHQIPIHLLTTVVFHVLLLISETNIYFSAIQVTEIYQ